MRAARLLHMLLLLQNRGRLTSAALATELEVSQRTILRDVDALTEAGLPIIVFQGNQGGIELGFEYRTRLTGLDRDEAAAMGLILSAASVRITALGMGAAAARASAKIWEAFPDQTRALMALGRDQFLHDAGQLDVPDTRLAALAGAVRGALIVRLDVGRSNRIVHPIGLHERSGRWVLKDRLTGAEVAMDDWGRINISTKSFRPGPIAQ